LLCNQKFSGSIGKVWVGFFVEVIKMGKKLQPGPDFIFMYKVNM
jgi:hypothetical protein